LQTLEVRIPMQVAVQEIRERGPGTLDVSGLTVRQRQVLDGIREGLGNKEIGARLHISHRTVKMHAQALYRRLRVQDRRDILLRYGMARG